MLRKIIGPLVAASALVFLTGCGEKTVDSNLAIASDVEFGKEDYKQLIDANNALGFDIFAEVEADDQNNTFISPTSLMMALSMVYNGADGETKEEMANTLHINGLSTNELNKANASLMTLLDKKSDAIQLTVANSIWLKDNFHFKDTFVQQSKDYFNAEIQRIDMQANQSSQKINQWVEKSTNGKIEEIVEEKLDADLVALLINAIYFKGDWTHPFDEKKTKEQPFQRGNGETMIVPLMTIEENLHYLESDHFQAVTLPYGEGEMSMNIFLPKESSTLDEFRELLTTANWTKWSSEFSSQEGTVLLPKFQIEYESLLNESLQNLGMKTAFDKDTADFTTMIKEEVPLFISEVKQKTIIKVNERGSEAAAVTAVGVDQASALPEEKFIMKVDRPFFFTITDEKSGLILFMGAIEQPLQEK